MQQQIDEARSVLADLQRQTAGARRQLDFDDSAYLVEVNEQLIVSALQSQTEAEQAAQALGELSKSHGLDPLTQLPNRVQLQERFAHAIASAHRHRTRLAVLFTDIDGFKGINRDGSNSSFVAIMGHHVKITRCLFKTQGSANNENCVVSVTGGASHVLFEDCALTGGYRYGFIVRGVSSAPHNVIFRRCVARGDWVQSSEPNSIFAVYGHNSSAASGPYNIMFQNCIAINQNASVPDADWKPYGPWYIFKGNHDIIMNGCITLDNDQTGSTSGSWIRNDYGGKNIDVINSVFWGFKGIGTVFAGNTVNIRNCTFGGNTTSYTMENALIRVTPGNWYGILTTTRFTFIGPAPNIPPPEEE